MIGFELLISSSVIISNAIYWINQENGKLYCKELIHYSDGGASPMNTQYHANIVYI